MLLKVCWVIGILIAAVPASAHRVNVFAWVEGDTVFVECKYPDGTKVHEGVIRVLDSAGRELLNGKRVRSESYKRRNALLHGKPGYNFSSVEGFLYFQTVAVEGYANCIRHDRGIESCCQSRKQVLARHS